MALKDIRIHKGLTQIEASRICNMGILYFFLRRIMTPVISKTSITPLSHNYSKI